MAKSDRSKSGEIDLERLTLTQRAELRAALVRRAHALRQDAIRKALQCLVALPLRRLVATWAAWRRRVAERHAAATLKAMTDAELSDMGLRRGEIEQKVRLAENNGAAAIAERTEQIDQERPRNPVASK